ncbi:MAG: outer membrane receptor protein involved in Fe transport [Saprospiraceae bacterium]|jgi:outer membrane receptor protein involved in Fe transport
MKRILLLFVLSSISITGMLAQTSLEGKVTDAASGEAILFGTIALYKNDVLISGTETDLDGNYFFSNIDPGTYDIEASYIGYTPQRQVGVIINAGRTNRLDFDISEGVLFEAVEIKAYKVPLIEIDNTTSGATVTAEAIRSLPTKSINAIAATTAGIASTDGGAISIRGSRSNGTVYYVDGVRVSGLIPQSEIDQLQVITGGVEAKYGDLVGGAISLTSKGPSSKFSGGLEVETSEYLDGYGYNLIAGNISGPILKNDEGQSIIGYRFSGQYRDVADNFPTAGGVYRASEEVIRDLEANPTLTIGESVFPSLEGITNDSEQKPDLVKARPNESRQDLAVTGKIDARISDNIDLTLSGSYDKATDQFGLGEANQLLNWTRNPFQYTDGYRANIRFRHKLGRQGISDPDATDEEKAARNTAIRNLYYTLQGSFERRNNRTEDPIHKDKLFNYGYFGETPLSWTPNYGIVNDTASYQGDVDKLPQFPFGGFFGHLGYAENEGDYIANTEINPILSQYNTINGFLETETSDAWGLYNNVGRVYNGFGKGENDILSINVTSGFDFLPGGSKKGRHSIQFGFLYEQRTNRAWNVNPNGLWDLARSSINNHINGIDGDNVVSVDSFLIGGVLQPVETYAPAITINEDNKFYRKVRELTGDNLIDYVNIDGIDPNLLSLDMFSAAELTNQGLVGYYGYDYLGNKLSGNVQFDDFFTSKDADGVRNFASAAFNPIYGAAYIQDKFSFRDIIFRVGVRMDYYDANTKVLKDPYSLYEINSAEEFFAINTDQTKPGTVDNDYKVYLEGERSTNVVGYRQGDNWFLPDGTSVSGGNVLFGGGLVYPSIKNPDAPSIKTEEFDTNRSFEDYEPQLNFMPRLAFSFPISDEAGFFAHYDVLYQRPTTNTIQTAVDYFYFERASGNLLNNPNLKPVRTIDYEVGFQQKLTNSSAMKISAYYKEQKDLIQARVYANLPAPVNSYESYGNLDFGTTKGFSFSYDRRRTSNLELSATYTLQFADGSGSDANSSRGINNRGIIRNLIPLSFDERHRITAVIDYRYGSAKTYNGPKIGDLNLFADAGINFNISAISGRPYTRRNVVRQFGGAGFKGAINGSRLPWTFNMDMRVDKRFAVNVTSEKKMFFNAYLRVQNVFDIRNVRNVFPFTGDPEDDGYLISSFGTDTVDQINSQNRSEESYLAAYNWRLDSFSNFTLPRRIYLGLIMDF